MADRMKLGWAALMACLMVATVAYPARAALIPQLGTCTPPLDSPVPDKTKGYGNEPSTRKLEVSFAWAYDAAIDADPAAAIAATTRVEVCWVGQNGVVHCPGWDGDTRWIVYDKAQAIGTPPDAAAVKEATTPAAGAAPTRFTIDPFDWDDTDPGKIGFLVVDAKQKPASLADVAANIHAGGFCGIPYRLATKQTGNPPPAAKPSDPGAAIAVADRFVAYGLLDPASPGAPCLFVPGTPGQAGHFYCQPKGWTFGDVCDNSVTNVAGFSAFNNPCVTQAGALLELDLLERIDTWQFDKAQFGVQQAGYAVQTWWNGPGALVGGTQGCPGQFCPTRVMYGNTPHSVGYGWGGIFSLRPDSINYDGYQSLKNLESGAAPDALHSAGLLRAIAHEYTHGLKETWKRVTGSSGLYEWGNNSESTADSMPARACITQYPGSGTPELPATQCVSSQTLYYNNLVPSGAQYLEDPGNLFSDPIFAYQGAMFYQYAASQFAYPLDSPVQQFAHLQGSIVQKSVSPVLFDPITHLELQLKDRRPDEGMDLLGYFYAALDTSGKTQLPCNSQSADTMERLDCVMKTYIGRSLDDEMLEFHTMLVLKDYADDVPGALTPEETDPRWRQDWFGDFNAGDTAKIYTGAKDPTDYAIRAEKPYLGPTDDKGASTACSKTCCGLPKSAAAMECDGLPRTHRVQDTYTRESDGSILVNTLVKGATLVSPHDVQVGALGSAYVSIHPQENYGNLQVYAKVKSGNANLRFRVFAIDKTGVPVLASGCNAPKGHEACKVVNGVMNMAVPVGATNADEILLVASAGKDSDASFSWRFGPAANTLHIVSPLASQPAVIGQYNGGTLETRQLVVYFTALDANGDPIPGFTAPDLVFFVNGHPIGGIADCSPSKPAGSCPVALSNAGGSYMAVITIPDTTDFYPLGYSGREDLGVITAGGTAQGDTAPDALEIRATPQTQATVLVLDTSGSMNDAGKLPAARLAAKLALDSMADYDYAGLVLFSTHSLLVNLSSSYVNSKGGFGNFPNGNGLFQLGETDGQGHTAREAFEYVVDNIPATGSTSIGDGLYRAQDALISAFGDNNNTLPQGVRQGVVLLSDGVDNCQWDPRHYLTADNYADSPLQPDGRGACTDPNGCFCDNNGCECDAHTVPTSWPWPPDKSSADYNTPSPVHIGYDPRSTRGKPVPFFTGVGVGQADMATIDELAQGTGGVSFWVPDPPPAAVLQMDFADGFRMAQDSLADYQRIGTSRVHDIADLPAFRVDAGTTELLVSVLSVDTTAEPPGAVELVNPAGVTLTATGGSGSDAVFRVASPATGTWTWTASATPPGAPGSDPLLFAEVAVRSPCRIFTRTAVDGGLPLPLPDGVTDDQRWRGRDILVQALLHDGTTPRADASIDATVTAPDGTGRTLALYDDGLHDDGEAGDGLFAARFRDTAAHQENAGDAADTYRVRYHASVSTGSGVFCPRERVDSATVHAAPDLDQDGLPDWWQEKYGLPTGSKDEDPDRDGLTNAEEFLVHTNPLLSDSDGAGESDLSEISAGRDPLDPADDATGKPDLVAVPGNGRVLLQPGVPVLAGIALEIQSGPTRQGPFSRALSVGSFSGADVAVSAPNDVETCYTARLVGAGVTSGWARPTCTTPRLDPVPPYVDRVALAGDVGCVVRPVAQLAIEAADGQRDVALLGETAETYDPEAEVSGLASMRLSPTTTDVPGAWQPFSSMASVDMGNLEQLAVVVRVSDGAGNESQDVWARLERCHGTGLSDSVLLEEEALELLEGGDATGARSLVAQSLIDLEHSLSIVDARLRAHRRGRCEVNDHFRDFDGGDVDEWLRHSLADADRDLDPRHHAHGNPDCEADRTLHALLSGARGLKKAILHVCDGKSRGHLDRHHHDRDEAEELLEKALQREYDAERFALARQKAL